jgi:hypothetical protein
MNVTELRAYISDREGASTTYHYIPSEFSDNTLMHYFACAQVNESYILIPIEYYITSYATPQTN